MTTKAHERLREIEIWIDDKEIGCGLLNEESGFNCQFSNLCDECREVILELVAEKQGILLGLSALDEVEKELIVKIKIMVDVEDISPTQYVILSDAINKSFKEARGK